MAWRDEVYSRPRVKDEDGTIIGAGDGGGGGWIDGS